MPTTGQYVFTPTYLPSASLGVPYALYDEYKETSPWNEFGNIYNFEGLYNVTYIVNGEEYKKVVLEQGVTIVAEEEPIKEGYTFSGWSEIPETMPNHDITVIGTLSANKYIFLVG